MRSNLALNTQSINASLQAFLLIGKMVQTRQLNWWCEGQKYTQAIKYNNKYYNNIIKYKHVIIKQNKEIVATEQRYLLYS